MGQNLNTIAPKEQTSVPDRKMGFTRLRRNYLYISLYSIIKLEEQNKKELS